MKYSFMSFSCPALDMDGILHIAKLYGYGGIEPRIGAGHKHGIETTAAKPFLKEAKRKAEEKGISICCIATPCSFANPANAEENIEQAKRAIELAAEVNSPVVRVFGGLIPEGVERKKSFDLIVEALTRLSEYALSRNVTVCMETHDGWCNPESVADILTNVNHPAAAVNWDIMHPVLTAAYPMEKAFEILKPWIRHVHVHDGLRDEQKLEFKPIGEGKVDHKTAVRLLQASGYSGFLSGEWIGWEPYEVHLPREIAALKRLERGV